MNSSIFNPNTLFKISQYVDKEYIEYIEDLIKILLIQINLRFMYFMKNPNENVFFTYDIIEMLLYVIIGVSVYWLIIKKIIHFR